MKVRLITGMFKMELCDISVTEDAIVLSSSGGDRTLLLREIESVSVTRHPGRNPRLEINRSSEIVEGVFVDQADADAFADRLKESMGSVLQINFRGQ